MLDNQLLFTFSLELNMTNFRLNLLAYSVMLGLTTGAVYANEPEQLQEINVSGNTETINVKEKKSW